MAMNDECDAPDCGEECRESCFFLGWTQEQVDAHKEAREAADLEHPTISPEGERDIEAWARSYGSTPEDRAYAAGNDGASE